jgi:hypothetical protein
MVKDQIAYFTRTKLDSAFQWSVTGGEIISGQGTYHIMVLWTEAGVGQITVATNNDEDDNAAIIPVFIHPNK